MRYLFRGQRRQTGEPIEGRVTAPNEDVAARILGADGIVVTSLLPDPAAPADPGAADPEQELVRLLERALDEAGFGVRFDYVTGRYEGKSVSLLDQEKIRKRVMALVDEVFVDSPGDEASRLEARRRIAQLLDRTVRTRQDLGVARSTHAQALESQVDYLTQALERIERSMASMAIAVRRAGQGQSRRPASDQTALDKAHQEVLIEVFQHNLELRKGLNSPASSPAGGGGHAASRLI